MKFARANELIAAEKLQNPDNSFIAYCENYRIFLQAFISEREEDYSAFLQNKTNCLMIISKDVDNKTALAHFVVTDVLLHSAILKLKFNDKFSAGIDLYKSFKNFAKHNAKHPEHFGNVKHSAIFNLVFGAIPEEYKKFIGFLGFEGNIAEGVLGIEHLYNNTAKYESAFAAESAVLLGITYRLFDTDDQRSYRFFIDKVANFESQSLLRYIFAASALQANQCNSLIDMINTHLQKQDEYEIPNFDYIAGVAHLRLLKPDAGFYLNRYLSNFEGTSLVKSAYEKLAWHYALTGNTKAQNKATQNVVNKGDDIREDDNKAFKWAKNGGYINHYLLKARLLFDGGNYPDALKMLHKNANPKNYPSASEKLEYFYRLSRVYHKKGDIKNAKRYYSKVVDSGANFGVYFAPYSALMLGNIFEMEKDTAKARFFYRKCLKINTNEYKNSIEQKAKAGINRLLH